MDLFFSLAICIGITIVAFKMPWLLLLAIIALAVLVKLDSKSGS